MKTKIILLIFCIFVSLLGLSSGRAGWQDTLTVLGSVTTGSWQLEEETGPVPMPENATVTTEDAEEENEKEETGGGAADSYVPDAAGGGPIPGEAGLEDTSEGEPAEAEPATNLPADPTAVDLSVSEAELWEAAGSSAGDEEAGPAPDVDGGSSGAGNPEEGDSSIGKEEAAESE